MRISKFTLFGMVLLLFSACQPPASSSTNNSPAILAAESFLADIAQNVAGTRLKVEALMPVGLDPHSFEPTPRDVIKIADCQLLIINGAGMEAWLQTIIDNVGGAEKILDASSGLTAVNGDPHFWLDPHNVIQYVTNIRDGLTALDPPGRDEYAVNASHYILKLQELDAWISAQTQTIPVEQRLLVTNHETFGYFATRYGFSILGSIIPAFSTDAAPSALELIQLMNAIRTNQLKVIFLETGSNPQLAEQIAAETGVRVISELYDHSLSAADGKAPTYLAMMKYNVETIVSALK